MASREKRLHALQCYVKLLAVCNAVVQEEDEWKTILKTRLKLKPAKLQEVIAKFEANFYDDTDVWAAMSDSELEECGIIGGLLQRWRNVYDSPTIPLKRHEDLYVDDDNVTVFFLESCTFEMFRIQMKKHQFGIEKFRLKKMFSYLLM